MGLQVLRPTHVRIVIDSRIDGRYGPFSSTGMYEGLRSFKLDRLVTALPHNIPSLSHIFITSAGELCNIGDDEEGRETWDVSRAWCVQRPGAGTQGPVVETRDFQVEELSAEAEEAAIDREEMGPMKRTEVCPDPPFCESVQILTIHYLKMPPVGCISGTQWRFGQ